MRSGLFPLYEIFDGTRYHINQRPDSTEVMSYLRQQRRFRQLWGNSESLQAQIDARLEREAAREAARQAASGEEASAERRQEAADRAAMCQENRSRLQTYIESRRLYREDENGERVYLDGDQREAAEEKVRELIAEYCN